MPIQNVREVIIDFKKERRGITSSENIGFLALLNGPKTAVRVSPYFPGSHRSIRVRNCEFWEPCPLGCCFYNTLSGTNLVTFRASLQTTSILARFNPHFYPLFTIALTFKLFLTDSYGFKVHYVRCCLYVLTTNLGNFYALNKQHSAHIMEAYNFHVFL